MTEDSDTLKKVKEQLNCSICFDIYTNPKLLQCFHVYCQDCLTRLAVQDQLGQLSITCPTCRQITPVPARGVAGFQTAFHISHLLNIMDEHKKSEETLENPEVHEVESASLITQQVPGKTTLSCSEHTEEDLKLYCETCEEIICLKCAIRGGKHHSHTYSEIKEAFESYKSEITSSLEPLEQQLAATKKALALVDTRSEEISHQQTAIKTDISDTIKHLHEVLDIRKGELLTQLHQITHRKLKGLATQRNKIETTQAQLSSCLDFMRKSLKADSQGEVLMMKATVVKQVKELATTFQPDILKPNVEADMTFSASVDIIRSCTHYGQVSAQTLPDPSQFYATGKGIADAVVGEKSDIFLDYIEDTPCKDPIYSLKCRLVSEITGARERGSVKRTGQNQYKVSYLPTIKGEHQLHISVEGQHIRGSPFSVAVTSMVKHLAIPIQTIGGVKGPWGVAVNPRGDVVIAEWDGHCVSVFRPSGEKLRSFTMHSSGQGELLNPCGVAVDGEGNILVTINGNHRIQKFTTEGQFLAEVGTEGSGLLQFYNPRGIAFNPSNNKIYVVDLNHRVQVLNSDFTFSSSFGKRGNGRGQFSFPYGIACDSTGKVYVADSYNNCIQVFTAEGIFLRMFGNHAATANMNYPVGIVVDASGLIYVSEGDNHCVSVFTSVGQFVMSFGKEEKRGRFKFPVGVAVDKNGVVYVCDHKRHSVQMF